jgi:NitT/TauT family transport system permease protein
MAGGWFFLMVSEAFVLGEHDFRLPGLGSYMSLAIERGDATAQVLGVLAMLGMIVVLDQSIWRPIAAWSQKFTDEERVGLPESWLWERIRRSMWALVSRIGIFWHDALAASAGTGDTTRTFAAGRNGSPSRFWVWRCSGA